MKLSWSNVSKKSSGIHQIQKDLFILAIKILTCLIYSHPLAVPPQPQLLLQPLLTGSWTCLLPPRTPVCPPSPRAPAFRLVLPSEEVSKNVLQFFSLHPFSTSGIFVLRPCLLFCFVFLFLRPPKPKRLILTMSSGSWN